MANARIAACAAEGRSPKITDLFEDVDPRRLMESLATLRVPRHLFKFMYRLFTTHCNAHTEDQPVWKISGRHVRVGLGAVPARSGRLRPRRGGGISKW